jgi:hypothetical protein
MNLLPIFVAAFALQGPQVPEQHLPKPPSPEKVLAKVNGVEIKAAEVEALLWDWRGNEVLQDVISYELIKAQAEKAKVSVPEIEVLKVVDDQLREIKERIPKDKDLATALREQGFPQSRLYLRVKTDLMLERMAEREFDPAKFVMVSTMVFRPKSESGSDLGDALKQADLAYQRLIKGSKWEDVLKTSGQTDEILGANGRLGWRNLDVFPPPAQKELQGAKVGQITMPVQTSAGIQFFRLDGLGREAKGEELATLKQIYMQGARRQILDRIKREGKVELIGS